MSTHKISIDQYLTERVEDQYQYYSNAAARAKRKFRVIRLSEIILAACIPFLSALIDVHTVHDMRLVVGLIGLLVTILSGSLMLFKYQDLWVTYRATAEAIKAEQYLFLTRSGHYGGRNSQQLFVERIESLLSEESQQWRKFIVTRSGSGEGQEETAEEDHPKEGDPQTAQG